MIQKVFKMVLIFYYCTKYKILKYQIIHTNNNDIRKNNKKLAAGL